MNGADLEQEDKMSKAETPAADFDERTRRLLERLRLEREKRVEAESVAMRAEGLEPAVARDDWRFVGLSNFTCAFRSAGGGDVEIRIWGSEHHSSETVELVGKNHPWHPLRLPAGDFVGELCRVWPDLAAPYLADGAYWPETMVLGFPGVPPMRIARVDGWLELSSESGTTRMDSESVIVVECLRAVADEIAKWGLLPEDVESRWQAFSDSTDLPRFFLDDGPPRDLDIDGMRAFYSDLEAWHAKRNGIDIDLWRRSAVDVQARHVLFFREAGEEPAGEEWSGSWTTSVGAEEVERLAEKAARIEGVSKDEFVWKAEYARISDARSSIYFREHERRDAFMARQASTWTANGEG